ncbi:hypothetical protein HYT23_00220 [Candidatus Pacearchaeota archaeon]|nr:hypothetical protein [Candidatus Pacearchaeota archaeon]
MEIMGRNSQMQLSFGMIFSIILIIFFLAFAFFGIKIFLGASDNARNAQFVKNLQNDIDDLWKSPQGSQEKVYDVSSKIEEICFIEDDYENIVFLPPESEELPPIIIKNIDIGNITRSGGSEMKDFPIADDYPRILRALCFGIVDEEIELILRKDFGKDLVLIQK